MNKSHFRLFIPIALAVVSLILIVAILKPGQLRNVKDQFIAANTPVTSTPVMMKDPQEGETSPGIIFKRVTFAELPPDLNNVNRVKRFLNTTTAKQIYDAGRETNDSTVILDNDTVWQVIINPYPARTSGCGWYAEMQLNGKDDSDDTLTYALFTYYVKLSSNWDWANGGKMIGLAGKAADGHFPPNGGVRGPNCNTPADYHADDGFSVRGGFDYESKWRSPGGEIGFYVYHQGFTYDDCEMHYGDTWNSRRTHGIDMTWEFNKWYKITHRIILNTPGRSDGALEWYRNDTCYVVVENVKYRNFDYINLDYFMLETFQGGAKVPGYEGAKVWYDDLTLWTDNDRNVHGLGYVMTYTPQMATPNIR